MSEVIGVKECNTNQITYIKTTIHYKLGDMIVVDNGKGQYIYECVRERQRYNEYSHKLMETKHTFVASSKHLQKYIENQVDCDIFKSVFKDMCIHHNINALLINVDFSLDGEHVKYTYFSTEKLNFPKLIKYLLIHNPRRVKIEFYQVGEREYYAINGGVGVCGYELCCHSRSHNTPTITSSLLENIGINLNLKRALTGTCGKYKCCLLFNGEDEKALIKNLPDLESECTYQNKDYIVSAINLNTNEVYLKGEDEIKLSFDYFLKGTDVSNE